MSVEGKLDGVFKKVQRLETALRGVKSDITELQSKKTQMKKATDDIDARLNNLNMEVQELEKEIKLTNDRCLNQEVYIRRENLRFLGLPEVFGAEEVAIEVIYQFLDRELEIDGARDIEFQRVHRIGKKKTGASRPIIACFLRFPTGNASSREHSKSEMIQR